MAESSWHGCDSAVHRLSGGRAPVLEQNSYLGAANRDSVHGRFGRGCLLGLPDAVRLAALKVALRSGRRRACRMKARIYSGRFQE